MRRLPTLFALLVLSQFALFAQITWDRLSFDMGTEPEPNKNVSYGMVQYGWTDAVSSRLDVRYTSGTELQCATATNNAVENKVEGYDTAIYSASERIFEADILPFVSYFGRNESGREFCWSVGLSAQYTTENEFAGMFDVNGLMLDPGDEGKYFTMNDDKSAFFLAPRLGFSAKMPLSRILGLKAECFIHPLYFMNLKQSMSYHSDQTASPFDYSGGNSVNRVSSPYVSVKVSLDILGSLRLVTLCTYQHLDFQQMDWAEDFNSLKGYDDKQELFTFRGGVELLGGNAKSARVRCGVYYQVDVNKSSYLNTTTNNNRWILNLGTEL